MKCKIGLIVSGILLIASTAMAVPTTINYQGVLTDSFGAPVTNPTQEMTFYIYDSEIGGSALWAETQLVNVENGNYNLQLGSDQPLTTSIFESNNLWLQVIVAGEPLNGRQQLTSVPFAFKADISEMAYAVDGSVSGDGSGLTNVAADWSLLTSVPADIADGDDVATTVNGMSGGTITSDLTVAGDISTANQINFTGNSNQLITVENLPTTGIYYNATTNLWTWRGAGAARGSIDLDDGTLSLQSGVEAFGNSALGTGIDPDVMLKISGVDTYSADIYNLKSTGDAYGIRSRTVAVGGDDHYGVFADAAGATLNNYGVFGQSIDANGNYNYGIYGNATGGFRNIAVHGIADDTLSDRNYGLSGYATGAANNFGVYGYAPVGPNSWAGYFDGNVNVAGLIYGDGSNLTNVVADWSSLSNIPADIADGDQDTIVSSVDGLSGGQITSNIGIGVPESITYQLYVAGSGSEVFAGYFDANYAGASTGTGIKATSTASGGTRHTGVEATAENATEYNTGVDARAVGGDYAKGVQATASGGQLANRAVEGFVVDASSANNVGVFGSASNGTSSNYGIYGSASGTNAYAGYFNGDVKVTGTIDGAMAPDSITASQLAADSVGSDEILQTEVQRRISGGCQFGYSIRTIGIDGTVLCEEHPTSVEGLTGGSIISEVGIGTAANALFKLDVYADENDTVAGRFNISKTSGSSTGIDVTSSGVGADSHHGIWSAANGATNTNIGIIGLANDVSGAQNNVGVQGNASGGTKAIGVKGLASDATDSYAGWFGGNLMVDKGITILNSASAVTVPPIPAFDAELQYQLDGNYKGALGYNVAGDYIYLYKSGNVVFKSANGGGVTMGVNTSTPDLDYKLYVAGNAWSTGSWAGSDERWKKNIYTLNDALHKVSLLRGVSYDFRTDEFPDKGFSDEPQIGVIAQEVEQVVPELVHTDSEGYKAVAYDKLTALLIEAVKELKAENDDLKARVSALESK